MWTIYCFNESPLLYQEIGNEELKLQTDIWQHKCKRLNVYIKDAVVHAKDNYASFCIFSLT